MAALPCGMGMLAGVQPPPQGPRTSPRHLRHTAGHQSTRAQNSDTQGKSRQYQTKSIHVSHSSLTVRCLSSLFFMWRFPFSGQSGSHGCAQLLNVPVRCMARVAIVWLPNLYRLATSLSTVRRPARHVTRPLRDPLSRRHCRLGFRRLAGKESLCLPIGSNVDFATTSSREKVPEAIALRLHLTSYRV